MEIKKLIKSIFGRSASGSAAAPAEVGAWSTRSGAPLPSWLAMPAPALGVASVYRCVKLLGDSVASLPIEVKHWNSGYFAPRRDRLWYLLNVQPCPGMSAYDFKWQMVADILLQGNAYALPKYDFRQRRWESITLLNPALVAYDAEARAYVINDAEGRVSEALPEGKVIHVMGMPGGDRRTKAGLSVLAHARMALNIARAGADESLGRMENGGNIRGVIANDSTVRGFGKNQEQQLKFAAADIDSKFREGQRIIHIPGSLDFRQLSMTSADMQFIETLKFNVREICRFFGVHPSFVFDDTSNNYKSAEMANAAFLSNTLNPLLRKIENELLRKLASEEAAQYRKIEFDRESLYACDLEGKMRYLSQQLGCCLATPNELRAKADLPPVEGGDQPLASANLKTLAELAGGQNQNQTQAQSEDGEQ